MNARQFKAMYQGEWEVKKSVIVLAGNYRQYLDYVRAHGAVSARDRGFAYGERDKMCGIEASEVVVTGTFWERADAGDAYEFANSRVR